LTLPEVLDLIHRSHSQAAKRCPRHQFKNAFHCPELRSVDFTAAANDNAVLRAVDATSGSNQ